MWGGGDNEQLHRRPINIRQYVPPQPSIDPDTGHQPGPGCWNGWWCNEETEWTEEKIYVNVFSGSIYMDGGVGIYSLVAGWHHLLAACGAVCSVVSVVLYLLSTTINQMSVSCSALCSLLAADTNTPTQQHNSSHLHLNISHCRVWRIPIPVLSGLSGNSSVRRFENRYNVANNDRTSHIFCSIRQYCCLVRVQATLALAALRVRYN